MDFGASTMVVGAENISPKPMNLVHNANFFTQFKISIDGGNINGWVRIESKKLVGIEGFVCHCECIKESFAWFGEFVAM